jgi:RimJ/RimL family protein N-acetyltransferase
VQLTSGHAEANDTGVTPIFETQRFKLREFRFSDLDELAAMVSDEDQMRFYPRPKTRAEARAWIRQNLSFYTEYGFGFWLIESIPGSDFLGYCGIRPLARRTPDIEMGWHIKKASWNQGIATEAATAAHDLAFTRFGSPELVALIHPDHTASRRIAEKIGMQENESAIIDGFPWVVYRKQPR